MNDHLPDTYGMVNLKLGVFNLEFLLLSGYAKNFSNDGSADVLISLE